MGMWNWLNGLLEYGGGFAGNSSPPHTKINPVTSLPMIGGIGGIDVAGNPFGTNHDHWHSHDGYPGYSPDGGGYDSW